MLPLWHRLARRLLPIERELLQALAVFRAPAPADVWQSGAAHEQAALTQLLTRRLVIVDPQGGLTLLPALREVIYGELPVEAREQYHAQAAQIRAERGEYTAAAHHFQLADQAEEINRGQASSALAIFEAISLRRLDVKTQKVLRLIRAELYQLLGKPEEVVAIHERDLEQAWQEVNRARYLAETIAGTVHDQSGAFDAARTHYTAALAIAQSVNDQSGVANTYFNLGNLAMRQQAIDDAITYYNQALTIHQAIGDRVAVEIARSGLVTAYMQATRFREAITAAKAALRFFQTMGHSYWTAINASNLAEAYTELNELDAAEAEARVVLEQEEPQSHPYALFTLGRVRYKQQQLQEAALYMEQARAVATLNGDRFLLAYCWEELGKIQQAMGHAEAVTQAFRQAYSGFDQLGIRNKAQEIAARLQALDA